MKERIIGLLLAIMVVFSLMPATYASAEASTGDVSRAEWISALVETFSMTVEADNYPDNYYSDISDTDSFYRDIMVALEFGVIDLEAGEAFHPNDAATREFAVNTLYYCLGFQPAEDTAYTFNDSANVTKPDAAQLALERGWIALLDGSFAPQQPITAEEKSTMLSDAEEILAADQVDPEHQNSGEFSEGVVIFPMGTQVVSNGEGSMTIYENTTPLSAGDFYVVYYDTLPLVFKALRVDAVDGGRSVLWTTDGTEEAIGNLDIQGTIAARVESFTPTGEASYVTASGITVQESATEYEITAAGVTTTKDIKFNDPIPLAPGLSAKIDAQMTNITLNYVINPLAAHLEFTVDGDTHLCTTVKGSLPSANGSNKIALGTSEFLFGLVKAGLYLEYDLSGEIVLTWDGHVTAGFSMSGGFFRLKNSFNKKAFTVTAHAESQLGLLVEVNGDIDALKARVWASVGVKGAYKYADYESGTPQNCQDFEAWMYMQMGAKASADFKLIKGDWERIEDIITKSNSPERVHYHYEDGRLVEICTRSEEFKNKTGRKVGAYYTSPTSDRFSPIGGAQGSYTGKSGEPVVIWEYDTDEEDGDTYAIITGYSGGSSALVIPATIDGYPVKKIGDTAFYGKTRLRTVVIPDGVTEIGYNAFEECTNLYLIDIPDSVTNIGDSAFYNTGLTQLNLPPRLTSLGGNVLDKNKGVTELVIPKSLANVENCENDWMCALYALYGSSVESVIFEEGSTAIPKEMCEGATKLKNVQIPDTVTTIEDSAFYGCVSLETIEIPDSVTNIGDSAFYNTGLTQLNLPPRLTSLGGNVLDKNKGVTEIVIPKSLSNVENCENDWTCALYALYGSSVESVIFEEGSTAIPKEMCEGATKLKNVQIPDTVTTIEDSAFYGCVSLETIEIPNSVTNIGDSAFYRCTSLKTIEIPNSVTNIGGSVFYGCTSLEMIEISYNVKEIGYAVFENCTALTSINLPDSVTDIGSNAFSKSGLLSITIPDSVLTMDSGVFSGCAGLTSVKLPQNLTALSSGMFQNCAVLTEIIWPEKTETISSNVFRNCDALTELVIPNTVSRVEGGAFYDCDALTKVVVPDSVTYLGTQVFYDCDALTDVKLGTGLTSIPASTFAQCDVLETVVIPYRVTSINSSAFKNCVALKNVTIPRATTSIASDAFSYYSRMTIYGVAGTYAETFAANNSIQFVNNEVKANTVTLSEKAVTMNNGATHKLVMTVEPANFTDSVSWKSGDTSIVTVADDGTLKALKVGTATVKVIVGSASTSCKVTVVQPVTSISLNRSSVNLEALETLQLTASVYPDNAADKSVSWSSSDESVASVDDSGLVTAHARGKATITVTALGGNNVSRSCTVTVTNNGVLADTVDKLESSHNYPDNSNDFWLLTREGEKQLVLTFDQRTELEDGFDYLYIYDKNGTELGEYTGTELAGQTVTVSGDTVRIKLVSDDSGSAWGFKVIQVNNEMAGCLRYDANGGTGAPMLQVLEPGETVVIPDSIPTREGWYFLGWALSKTAETADYCPGDSVEFDESVTLYAVWATPEMKLPTSLTAIEEEAFADGAFTSVQLSEKTTSIGKRAFAGCRNLKWIYIPETSTNIAADAFDGVMELTILGKTGSAAESFATAHGFDFIAVS